jgi:hypothetical protein
LGNFEERAETRRGSSVLLEKIYLMIKTADSLTVLSPKPEKMVQPHTGLPYTKVSWLKGDSPPAFPDKNPVTSIGGFSQSQLRDSGGFPAAALLQRHPVTSLPLKYTLKA